MRVRVEDVRVGDVLYGHQVCQFQNGSLNAITKRWFYNAESATIAMLPLGAEVEVDRPERMVTLTIELTEDEARETIAFWEKYDLASSVPLDRAKARAALAAVEAIARHEEQP